MKPARRLFIICMIATTALSACSTSRKRGPIRPYPYKSYALEMIHKKNFSTIRTNMAMKGLTLGSPILIRAFKSEKELEVWVKHTYKDEYRLYKTYKICKLSGALGPKQTEGDLQTPEGFYSVSEGRLNPNSTYFLAMNIGYPNAYDRALERTGGALMIHGNCVSEGCLAMTDAHIGDIYLIAEQALLRGAPDVPVQIFPFRMTDENMALYAGSDWMPFWENLKEGYDYFEKYHLPPTIDVQNAKYFFYPRVASDI